MPSPFYYGDPGAQRGLSDLPRFPKQPIGAVAGAGPPCSSHHTGSVQLKVEGSGSLGLDGNASSFPLKPQPSERSYCSIPRIVKEVRSIRFNQEQKEELMHSHLPPSLSVASGPSVDIRVT